MLQQSVDLITYNNPCQARVAVDKMKATIQKSQKAYLRLRKARILSIFSPSRTERMREKLLFYLGVVKLHIVLIADYQMVCVCELYRVSLLICYQDKLVPHFGNTEQVSFSFFSYHVSVSIFGIVDASRKKNFIYLTDKLQAGSKRGNHTVNYLIQCVFQYLLRTNTLLLLI